MRSLPHWARVAFAARCARRVLPLFEKGWPQVSPAWVRPVREAILLAESAAAATVADADAADAADAAAAAAARAAHDAADIAYDAVHSADNDADADAAHAARFVAAAADAAAAAARFAARAAARAAAFPAQDYSALAAADAAAAAADAADAAAIRRDFDLLRDLARREGWTDATPVPPTVFGPLWPDGPPPGWPGEPVAAAPFEGDPAPPLSLLFEVGTLTPYEVTQVIGLVGDIYRAISGDELVIDSTESYDPVGVPVPEGSLQ